VAEAVWTAFAFHVLNAGQFDGAAGLTLRSIGGPNPPRSVLRRESETTRSPSLPSAGRGGEPSYRVDITAQNAVVKLLPRPKSFDPAIVGRLSRILPPRSARPSPEVADGLTDARRLVQIGLVLGMAYVAFLTFWFWGTRARGRRVSSGRES
jgi:hypothetical protein